MGSEYEGPIEGMSEKELRRLSERRIRSMDRDEVSELLEKYESKLEGKQKLVVAEVVEKLLAEDEEEDEGFVLEPGNPDSPKNRHRSSIDESVWCANTPRGSTTSPPNSESNQEVLSGSVSMASPPSGRPDTVVHRESSFDYNVRRSTSGNYYCGSEETMSLYESSVYDDADASVFGGSVCESSATSPIYRSPGKSSEYYNEPKRANASVENIDTECTAKRRAKAADDAREFGRALKWVYAVLQLEPLPADIESRPEDCFGEQLSDGVLLCNLLNAIKPNTVRKVTKRTTVPFHMMANITNFVRGCQALGVKKRDCFDTLDLQTARDLSKVYETLLMLNRAVKKTCPHYKGPFLLSAKQVERMRASQRRSTSRQQHHHLSGSSSMNTPNSQSSAPPTPLYTPSISNASTMRSISNVSTIRSASLEEKSIASALTTHDTINQTHLSQSKVVPLAPPRLTDQNEDDPSAKKAPIALRFTSPRSDISSVTVSTNAQEEEIPSAYATIDTFVASVGLDKYATKIADIADDINDLKEMTEVDYQSFVTETKMPSLKAKRLKKALIDLGAPLTLQQ